MKVRKLQHHCSTLNMLLLQCSLIVGSGTNALPQPVQPNSGISCVLALARLQGHPINTEEQLIKKYPPQATISLTETRQIASVIGLKLIDIKGSLDELLTMQRPMIIHLLNPSQIILLLDGTSKFVRMIESPASKIVVIPRAEIERRFNGSGLILPIEKRNEEPQIRMNEHDYHFGTVAVGQNIKHGYTFVNNGRKDLEVSIAGAT